MTATFFAAKSTHCEANKRRAENGGKTFSYPQFGKNPQKPHIKFIKTAEIQKNPTKQLKNKSLSATIKPQQENVFTAMRNTFLKTSKQLPQTREMRRKTLSHTSRWFR